MKKIPIYKFNKYLKKIFILNFFIVSSTVISGQSDTINPATNLFEGLDKEIKLPADTSSLLMNYRTLITISSYKKEIAENSYATEYSKKKINNFIHTIRVFEWQLLSSKFIFFIVMVVVLSGILFSGLQFYQSFKLTSKVIKIANSKNLDQIEKIVDQDNSNISVSPTNGFSVTTSIVGLLVLGISIGFFYLYLTHVYPIKETSIDNPTELNVQISEKK